MGSPLERRKSMVATTSLARAYALGIRMEYGMRATSWKPVSKVMRKVTVEATLAELSSLQSCNVVP